jgi:cell division protein FtsI (penicillin-binding protein 3)
MLRRDYKIRILIVAFALFTLYSAVAGRLYYLQIVRHDFFKKKAKSIHRKKRTIAPYRGEIVDRNGHILALSTRQVSVYVYAPNVPKELHKEAASRLASVLNIPESKILSRLKSKYHLPLARKIPEERAEKVKNICNELGIKENAIYFKDESKRFYPNGNMLASVLGYTTIDNTGDNKGIFGLEMKYNEWISGKYEKVSTHKTGRRQFLDPVEQKIIDDTYGNRLVLTIDQAIQYEVECALKKGVAEFNADSAVAIVLSVKTGEILALSSLPSFDPNKFYAYDKDFRRNRCISDPLEPGSVMKIFTSAILLDLGLVTLDEIIDCEGGRARIEGRRVTDSHAMYLEAFTETFYHSSNIAFSKLGLRIEPSVYYSWLRSFGFGRKTGVDLPDESPGILHPLRRWTKFSRTSLPIGYEIGITPLQAICAVSAMGNKGKLMRPYIVSEIQDYRGRTIQKFSPHVRSRMVSEETAEKVLSLMEGVIEKGTGKKARIEGYRIGGKTGTTRKSDRKKPEYIASFAAIFPVDDPQIACYVAVDHPREKYYAAEVAVPIFNEISRKILTHLAISPSVKKIETDMAEHKNIKEEFKDEPVPIEKAPRITVEGFMPDFSGLTMKEVLEKIGDSPVEVKFIGSGVVIEQNPAPDVRLKECEKYTLVFGKKFMFESR